MSDDPRAPVYSLARTRLLSFHEARAAFRSQSDTPRGYLER